MVSSELSMSLSFTTALYYNCWHLVLGTNVAGRGRLRFQKILLRLWAIALFAPSINT